MGYVDLDPNDDDARIDGEAVVNQRDIIMLDLRQTTKKICVIVMMRPVHK